MNKPYLFKQIKRKIVDIKIIKKYLKYIDVNSIENDREWTALHYACDLNYNKKNRIELIKYLIDVGADPYAKTKSKYTSLHIASINPMVKYDVIKYLIDRSDTVNSPNILGSTPFHLACKYIHNKKIIDYFISNTANINKEDNDGNTSLYYCLKGSNKDILVYLIKRRGAIIKKNNKGKTVFDLDPGLRDRVKKYIKEEDKDIKVIPDILIEKKRIDKLILQNKTLIKKTQELEKSNRSIDDKNKKLKNIIEDNDRQIKIIRDELIEKEKAEEDLKQQVDKKLLELSQSESKLKEQFDELDKKNNELKEKRLNQEEIIKKLEIDQSEFNEEKRKLEFEKNKFKFEIMELQSLNKKNIRLEKENIELKKKNEDLKKENEEKDKLKKELRKSNFNLQEINNKLVEANETINKINITIINKDNTIKKQDKDIIEKNNTIKKNQNRIKELENEELIIKQKNQNMKSEIEELILTTEELESDAQSQKIILEKCFKVAKESNKKIDEFENFISKQRDEIENLKFQVENNKVKEYNDLILKLEQRFGKDFVKTLLGKGFTVNKNFE